MNRYNHIKVGSQVTFSFNKEVVYLVKEIDPIARTAYCTYVNDQTNQEEIIELPLQTLHPIELDGPKS